MGVLRTRARAGAAAAAALLVAISVAGPAFAAQQASGDDGSLQIRQVDARDADAVAVDFSWTGEPAAVEGLTIAEGGEEVDHEPATPDVPPMAIVLAVDVSEAMEGTALVQTKAALTEWLAVRPEGSRVALVTFNDEARIVVDFTTDTASLQAAIDELTGSGATALWNGVVTAAESFETVPDLQHNIVLVSGAPDSASTATPSAARGAVTGQDASVYAIGTGGSETASLQSLVSAAGGTLASTDEAGIPAAVDEAGLALAQQYQVVFARSDPEQNVAALELQIGDASAEASFVSGGVIEGGSRLAPKPASEPEGFAPLQGNSGKMMAILATLVAVSLGVYALVMALSKDPSGLQSVLSPYGEGYSGGEGGEGEEVEGDSALAKNAIIQRAVDMTENFAEKQGFLAKAEGALERANLPLRAAEAMFFYAAFVVVVTLLGIILKGILVGLIVALIAGLAGPASVNFIAKRRRKKFVSQLPDTLSLLSGTLRAGYSLMQGVEAVAQEVDEPMGMELRRVCTEARLGRPLEEALDASADRMDSPDFSWAVMAISIQREVGGNLSELLLTVADTMTQRERLRRDVAALTAEGKISAIVLGILPPALAVVMWVVNPEYIGLLFNTTIGNVMLGAATLLALFGFWWMKKCVEIEI